MSERDSARLTESADIGKDVLDFIDRVQMELGHELHDTVGQTLAGAAFKAKALSLQLAETSPDDVKCVTDLLEILSQCITELRRMMRVLSPVLGDQQIVLQLSALAASTEATYAIPCSFHCDEPILIQDANMRLQVLRIAQEALSNAARHSRATQLKLKLNSTEQTITLGVSDNGSGFDTSSIRPDTLGLKIMSHRAKSIGGELRIVSEPSKGTSVVCTFPVT